MMSMIKPFGKQVKILLFVVLMAVAFRSLGMSIVDIGLPSFVISLAGSLTSYGIIIGIFSVTQSIFQFPYAFASDKFGRRKIVFIGISIYIAGTFLCFIAQDIFQLIIFRAIQGIGAYTSILQATIGDIFGKDQHGKGMGYYSLAMNIGYFGGIIVGGYISSYLGFRSIFSISGLLIIIVAFFLFIVLKENKSENLNNGEVNTNKMALNLENVKLLLKNDQFIMSVLLNCVRWFLFGGIVAYLIWILQVQFLLDEIQTSYVLIGIVALYVVFVFVSSRVLDRQGPRKMMIIGQSIVLIFGIPFIIEVLAYNLIIFITLCAFIGIGIALFDPAGNTLLLEVIEDIKPELKGSGIGFNNAIGFFCGAMAPMIISPIGEINVFAPFYLILALMGFSLIITYNYVHKCY
ncbi:MAG: MFS transporter [Candidatus Lokiarchaeota archaeon]|nr:MFS transporter [Candidatus Lokiarchaeota archaeon]